MKTLILEYLANFISRWNSADDDKINGLESEYTAFTRNYKLPNVSADELKRSIESGEVIIDEQDIDLFEQIDTLPQAVQDVLDYFSGQTGYSALDALLEELESHGYTFDYGLDAVPHSLRKIEQESKFKEETVIITNVFMSTEDIGGDEDVKVGTIGVVFHEPSDDEDSVGVIMNNSRYYISQHAIEPFKEKALKTPTELKEKWMNKLEESKTQSRKFQPHDNAWDFVEEYYPNYSSADNICRALDLFLKKEQNGDTLSDEEDTELTYIMEDVYQTAINAFIQSQNK